MSIFSEVNARTPKKQDADETDKLKVRLFFGVFFDGTSNNMIERAKALAIRKKHTTGLDLFNHHAYERIEVEKDDAADIDRQKDDGFYKLGNKFKGFSNVAIMHSKYQGIEEEKRDEKGYLTKVYKIYVEGSGANDINNDKIPLNGLPFVGLGFGVGKTGVVALVSKAVVAVEAILKTYRQAEKIELHFDVFGFSRGSACGRLFSYLVCRNKNNKEKAVLEKREREFGEHSAKGLYDGHRLKFLDDFVYGDSEDGPKTKKVDFLGIFDTVASMGVLRRKREDTERNGHLGKSDDQQDLPKKEDNRFLSRENQVNVLRAGMMHKDFWGNWHDLNAKEYGLFPSSRGINTFHICALDEFRENFALVDIGEKVPDGCLELFLPGCHSDIGGGYICGDETRAVINLYPSFFAADTEKKDKKKEVSMVVDKPQCEDYVAATLSLTTLATLGWIPVVKGDDKHWWSIHQEKGTSLEADGERIQGSHTMAESLQATQRGKLVNRDGSAQAKSEFWEDDKRVGFKRTTPSFFSNVPLRLMVERARKQVGRHLFSKELDISDNDVKTSFYDVPAGLKEFYQVVRAKVIDSSGRMFVMPDGKYASQTYKDFRLNYLHFTSEQNFGYTRLWDVPNEYDHVICRIVYHGGENDQPKMHYMQDYNIPCS